ncbi:uncharacterized protein LOC143919914 [Arctopsyche grandis]|uniref:uncharacterized protein LOC143919914 n=1 Tax=Arctopsyche grandis TaxID=121162 RepID=UPI00406D8BFB
MVFDGLTSPSDDQQHVLLIVDINRICRFCLRSSGAMTSIFDDCDKSIIEQLKSFVDIQVSLDASKPEKICHRCRYMIEMCHEFKTMVLQSNKTLSANLFDDGLEFIRKTMSKEKTNEITMSTLEPEYDLSNIKKDSNEEIINPTTQKLGKRKVERLSSIKKRKKLKKIQPKDVLLPRLSNLFVTSKNKECLLCLEEFSDDTSLHSHIDSHIQGTDLEPYYQLGEKNLICKHCGKKFSYRFNLLVHQREYLNLKPFTCSYDRCEAGFHSKPALRQHTLIHGKRNFICSVCAIGFKRKSDLKGHEIIHEDAGVKYECPICGFMCKNRLTKAAHLKKHQRQPMYKCGSCSKVYFSRSELERHEFIHFPEKRFRCIHCPYAYYSRSALSRHEKIHHTGEGKVKASNEISKDDVTISNKCNLCDEIHPPLTSNLQDVLNLELPLRCSYCNSSFLEKICFDAHTPKCANFKIQYPDVFT